MIRTDMISTVGREYLTSNIENDEYRYPKAFAAQSLTFNPIRNKAGRAFEKEVIMLPATTDNKPDFCFMENYMKSLPYGDRI